MRLTEINTYIIKVPAPFLGGMYWYFVKLSTDEGIVGWGETMALKALHGLEEGYPKIMEGIFNKYIKGQNPFDRELLFKEVYNKVCGTHADFLLVSLYSAIDIALWDICGKACGVPIYDMLGGKCRDKLRSYSYVCRPEVSDKKNYYPLWGDPQALAERSLEMVEEGFTALKYDPLRYLVANGTEPMIPYNLTLQDMEVIDSTMSAMRAAVGNNCDILLGTHGQTTTSAAIRIGKIIEPYNPLWFEEPVPPENAFEMGKVRQSTTVPIASGERCVTIHDYVRLLKEGAISIAQPDLGTCGGITSGKKIAAMCEAEYVEMAPHVWGGPIITAAGIQLSTAIPNFLIQESIYKSQHFTAELLKEPIKWDKGYIIPSDKPGLGIEVDEEVVKKYSI
ncbi:MAG: mandelate racemase/muconate lactonizing enzyme family protein [Desulfitobacteriia bacterium]|jgi:galactonate dehydratase